MAWLHWMSFCRLDPSLSCESRVTGVTGHRVFGSDDRSPPRSGGVGFGRLDLFKGPDCTIGFLFPQQKTTKKRGRMLESYGRYQQWRFKTSTYPILVESTAFNLWFKYTHGAYVVAGFWPHLKKIMCSSQVGSLTQTLEN